MMNNVPCTRICRTAKGHPARVPIQTHGKDKIVLLRGSSVPFVVREITNSQVYRGTESRFVLIDSCYVHGIMPSEKWEDNLCRDLVFI